MFERYWETAQVYAEIKIENSLEIMENVQLHHICAWCIHPTTYQTVSVNGIHNDRIP